MQTMKRPLAWPFHGTKEREYANVIVLTVIAYDGKRSHFDPSSHMMKNDPILTVIVYDGKRPFAPPPPFQSPARTHTPPCAMHYHAAPPVHGPLQARFYMLRRVWWGGRRRGAHVLGDAAPNQNDDLFVTLSRRSKEGRHGKREGAGARGLFIFPNAYDAPCIVSHRSVCMKQREDW
jgi:hypothetical protein